MTGDHRGATAGAKGSWPVAIIAAAAVVLAFAALLVYELEFATLLENYACVAATWLLMLVVMAVWRRGSSALLWVNTGPLVLCSWQVISTLADERRWQARHHLIPLAGRFVLAGAIACMATGAVIAIRSGELWLPRSASKLIGVSRKDSADPPPA
jgi:hypothetical protein